MKRVFKNNSVVSPTSPLNFKHWLDPIVLVGENDAVVSIGKQTLWPGQNDLRPRFI